MFRLHELKGEGQSAMSTSVSTPQPVSNIVHYLAQALAQIEQGIERKFLKAPLGKICLALASIETLRVLYIYLYKGLFLKIIASWRVCSCMDDCFVFKIMFFCFVFLFNNPLISDFSFSLFCNQVTRNPRKTKS